MKKTLLFFTAFFICSFVIQINEARAFTGKGETSFGYFTNYVWRGIKKTDDRGAAIPYVSVSAGNVETSILTVFDNNYGEGIETQYSFSYKAELEKFYVKAGYIYYNYFGNANDTQEYFADIGFDVAFNPKMEVYYDFEEGHGAFTVFSIYEDLKVVNSEKATVGFYLAISANFENKNMGFNKKGHDFNDFYNVDGALSINIEPIDNFFIIPKIAFTSSLSENSEHAIESLSFDRDSDYIYGGISIKAVF